MLPAYKLKRKIRIEDPLSTAEIMQKLGSLISTATPAKLECNDPYFNVKEGFGWLVNYLHENERLDSNLQKEIADFAEQHEARYGLQTIFIDLMVELNPSPTKRREKQPTLTL